MDKQGGVIGCKRRHNAPNKRPQCAPVLGKEIVNFNAYIENTQQNLCQECKAIEQPAYGVLHLLIACKLTDLLQYRLQG